MAVQNDHTYLEGTRWEEVSISFADTSSATSTATFPSFGYGNDYTNFYNKVEINSKSICEQIDQDILDSIYRQAGVEECLKVGTFNPEKLWSDSKCLKQNIVQSVREKLYLDIIFLIKTLKSQKEK
jgi:hypothetical protein